MELVLNIEAPMLQIRTKLHQHLINAGKNAGDD